MNFRRWAAIVIVASVAGGALLMGVRLSGLRATSAGTAESAAMASASAPASSAASPAGVASGTFGSGGAAVAAGASNAVPAAAAEEDLFKHHAGLVVARQAVWDYQERVKSAGVPVETSDLFREWAMVLYRDSLQVGLGKLPATDPAAQELAIALRTDTVPRIAMIQMAELGAIPASRTTNLLSKIAALQGVPGLPEAQWMAAEFEHLFKKAKQRSDSYYMSEMKKLLNSQAPVEEKMAYVDQFVEIDDVTLAEYPREYFEQLLQENTLNPDQRVNVQDLLQRISQMRTP